MSMPKRIKVLSLVFSVFLCSLCGSQLSAQKTEVIKVIPEPVSIIMQPGDYLLPRQVRIYLDKSGSAEEMRYIKKEFSSRVRKIIKDASITEVSRDQADVKFVLLAKRDTLLKEEGYTLTVDKRGITIIANKPAGLYYGIQTLIQMMPLPLVSATNDNTTINNVAIPYARIKDYPRFAWRGLMLDVARHFFTKQEVMDYIKEMSRYKYNTFHWHLTDDEGWRVQIKQYPRLTSIGAWNVKKTGYFGTFSPVSEQDTYTYGGFYTQDDIREVVKYAQEHFVNILPEFDMPGHSMAAIAAYPELSCTPGADKYHVRSGEEGFMDWTDSGIVAHYDNTLCPANPRVYQFLDTVFSEVAALFPFPYIHIGGDECAKTFWKINPEITALMKQAHLKNMDEVQSYFEKKVEKIVESKGKKVIGWDEILEGGVAPNATIMSWRGEKGGIKASQMKHDVIMSPTTYAYLDYMQGDPALEPKVYASLRLKKAYEFDPVPKGADAAYIKGGQANLWSEQLYNIRHAQYMTWPRAFAIAESLWSPRDRKNWPSFVERVEAQFPRLDADTVKYARSMYDPDIAVSLNADSTLSITLTKELDNIELYYSVDNSFPDNYYPKYKGPFNLPKDVAMLRVISYRDGKPIGRLITIDRKDLNKRVKK